MEEVNRYWYAFEEYKEIAQQHEFMQLFIWDTKLIPMYNDLQQNYTEEHAAIFIRVMKKVLKSLYGEEYELRLRDAQED